MGRDETFGALLRRYRRRAGLSQEELAGRAFVSTRAISDLERGVNARPRLHTAVALADGLGLDGGEREVFQRHARPDVEADDRPAPVGARARPPLTVDAFVDDGSTLDELLALVADGRHRLVTLLGPGGVGKTRLALEMAHRLDGQVAFVALASVSDPALVAATIVDALGAEHAPTRTPLQSLVEHVGSEDLTLVLDNMEQIADAARDVSTLIRSCPGLRVVTTSRVPLHVAGEVQFPVRPLASVGDGPVTQPAVRLFTARAATIAGGSIGEADRDLGAVAELCTRLDGLPLAIELAAARSHIVAPADILRHLDQVLDLLSADRSDAPEQHRSMRAALEWSYRLLPPAAQDAFSALGAFATSASAEAVMAVWGLPPTGTPQFFDLVQVLAEAHLVSVERVPQDAGVRLDMLATTRQFAGEKLAGAEGGALVHARLVQWSADLVDRFEAGVNGPGQLEWLDTVDRELPNLRAVVHRLTELGADTGVETGMRIVAGLPRFWEIRCRWHEAIDWLRAILTRPGGSAAVRAKAHKALGVMHRCLGDLEAAEHEQGRAAALYAEAGDDLGVSACLNNMGVIALDRGAYQRADGLFRQALRIGEAHSHAWTEAIVRNNLGLTTLEAGQLLEAFRQCRRSRDLLEAHANHAALSWPEDNLAYVLTLAGHPRWAVPIHHRTIRRRLELGDENGFTWSLEALAAAWTATDEADLAGRALGFVEAHRQRLGMAPVPHLAALTRRRSDALVARVGADRLAQLREEGAALDPELVRQWFAG